MAYVGIPIKVQTQDAEGNWTQYEQAVFGTAIRHPRLGELLRALARASVDEDAAGRLSILAQRKLLEAGTTAEVASLADEARAAAEAAETATQAYAAAVRAFIVAGFECAGYDREGAERYADLLGSTRLGELKAACLIGGGKLDFTKAPGGA